MSVEDVTKTFGTTGGARPVLDGVSLRIHTGEVVALLGKSGSGKSTLLRCIAGLAAPSSGRVVCGGEPVDGPNPATAMVFQTFALMPWLTVQQNVELGLEARGVGRHARAERAMRAIDLVGLDGFESAYPRELSGGMRQRVGLARALVVEPDLLLMDEPFSALDVATAENLRGELMELLGSGELPISSVLLVTHNIEEAVQLADRVVVLGSDPGRVRAELAIDLPRPRDRGSAAFGALVDEIYALMTGPHARPDTPRATPLPHASVDALSGLAEILAGLGPVPVGVAAGELGFEVDDLLPLVDALELLGFAAVEGGRLALTDVGAAFAGADIQVSKRIFAGAALQRAPLVRAIAGALDRAADGTLRAGLFRDLLRHSFSEAEAERQLAIAADWGGYAEQYALDADHDELVADPDRRAIFPAEADSSGEVVS